MKDLLKSIYSHLEDDLSKFIFSQRVCYSLLDDYKYIFRILKEADLLGQEFSKIKRSDVVIFSAGRLGKMVKENYRNINVLAFIDNFLATELYEGIPVISLQEYLMSYKGTCILLANKYHDMEIYQQLKEAGVKDEEIVNLGAIHRERIARQYFDLPQLNLGSNKEVFVDCGCYDGFSTEQFIHYCDGNYEKVWAFEPDRKNIVIAKKRLEHCCVGRYELINSGVWNENTNLRFFEEGNVSSSISSSGNTIVNVSRMDDVVQGNVTLIKMDIEGAESEALQGCKRIIQEYKPRLAISVYHKKDDILRIPELILEMNSDYHFYLRHYSITEHDTILYAV